MRTHGLGTRRAETGFDDSVDTYAPEVYERAKELLQKDIEDGIYEKDADDAFFSGRIH